jgi:hypothetical protein
MAVVSPLSPITFFSVTFACVEDVLLDGNGLASAPAGACEEREHMASLREHLASLYGIFGIIQGTYGIILKNIQHHSGKMYCSLATV